MNLPNKLTVTRLVMAPFFLLAYFIVELMPSFNPILYTVLIALMYGVMELTDLLDGKIARKRHLVTDLGKVLDPFADVICHLTFFTLLLSSGIMPIWAYMPIMWREFSQSFTRMLMMGTGKAMAANIFGKAKTCLYALTCVLGLGYRVCQVMEVRGSFIGTAKTALDVLFGLAALASVASYLVYVRNIRRSGALSSMTR